MKRKPPKRSPPPPSSRRPPQGYAHLDEHQIKALLRGARSAHPNTLLRAMGIRVPAPIYNPGRMAMAKKAKARRAKKVQARRRHQDRSTLGLFERKAPKGHHGKKKTAARRKPGGGNGPAAVPWNFVKTGIGDHTFHSPLPSGPPAWKMAEIGHGDHSFGGPRTDSSPHMGSWAMATIGKGDHTFGKAAKKKAAKAVKAVSKAVAQVKAAATPAKKQAAKRAVKKAVAKAVVAVRAAPTPGAKKAAKKAIKKAVAVVAAAGRGGGKHKARRSKSPKWSARGRKHTKGSARRAQTTSSFDSALRAARTHKAVLTVFPGRRRKDRLDSQTFKNPRKRRRKMATYTNPRRRRHHTRRRNPGGVVGDAVKTLISGGIPGAAGGAAVALLDSTLLTKQSILIRVGSKILLGAVGGAVLHKNPVRAAGFVGACVGTAAYTGILKLTGGVVSGNRVSGMQELAQMAAEDEASLGLLQQELSGMGLLEEERSMADIGEEPNLGDEVEGMGEEPNLGDEYGD